jgi:hypothetical protein
MPVIARSKFLYKNYEVNADKFQGELLVSHKQKGESVEYSFDFGRVRGQIFSFLPAPPPP